MVPLGPPLLAYKSNCKAMLTAVDGAVQLMVDRPYKAGEAIAVWYLYSQLLLLVTACYKFGALTLTCGDALEQSFTTNCKYCLNNLLL